MNKFPPRKDQMTIPYPDLEGMANGGNQQTVWVVYINTLFIIFDEYPISPTEQSYEAPMYTKSFASANNGKQREIWVPNDAMKRLHNRFLNDLYELGLELPAAATGSIRGRSIKDNIQPHADNRFFFQLDFADAYSQVDIETLGIILEEWVPKFKQSDASQFLLEYCVPPSGKGLAIGSPSSPLLFNIYCMPLDEALTSYCNDKGITYTRYLDDITFSKPENNSDNEGRFSRRERNDIREIIEGHALAIKQKKTRVNSDVNTAPVIVTGVQVNRYGNWQITERVLRRIIGELEEARKTLSWQQIHDLAAGYKGMLLAVGQPGRTHKSKSEQRLLGLINEMLEPSAKILDF